jgi:polar amino acid transport system substrate-binding protein
MRYALIVLLLAICRLCSAVTIALTTEDYPPFNTIDKTTGKIHGVATDKVLALLQRAGEQYTLNAFPWSRAYQMALRLPNTCVFSTTRTPEREAMFKWVGPLVKNNWVVFARADDTRKPSSLEELMPYVLGAYRNDAVGEFLQAKGFKTDIATLDSDNPRKLLLHRFDFWATGELLGQSILKSQGLSGQIVPLFQFNRTEMYLACHLAFDQGRIDQLNHILKQMEQDGSMARIEAKYR